MFWLHTVVLTENKKITVYKQSLHCSWCWDIIDTSLQPFTVFIKWTQADIIIWLLKLLIRYYNAYSRKKRYRIRHWIPMFIGTHCIYISCIYISFFTLHTTYLIKCWITLMWNIFYNLRTKTFDFSFFT